MTPNFTSADFARLLTQQPRRPRLSATSGSRFGPVTWRGVVLRRPRKGALTYVGFWVSGPPALIVDYLRLHCVANGNKHASWSKGHSTTGSAATTVVCRLLDFIVSGQPSNSRTTLSVHVDPRLQARRLVNGQHKRLSLSARTVKDIRSRQVAAQARQATSASGPLTELKLCRPQRRLAPNHGVRTRQAGQRTRIRSLRHTTRKQNTTTQPVLRSRDLRPWEDGQVTTRRTAQHLQWPT